jgi:hypothetical protein
MPVFVGLAPFNVYGLITFRRPIITLSPDGLLDRRLAPDFIPWQSIESIDAQITGKYKFISILIRKEWKEQLSPAMQANLKKQSKVAGYRTIMIFPGFLQENAQGLASSIRIVFTVLAKCQTRLIPRLHLEIDIDARGIERHNANDCV